MHQQVLPVSITFAGMLLTHRPCQSFLRLYNYEPQTPLRMLRASVYGRLVCVRGTVVRVSSIRPQCTRMAFKCRGDSHVQTLPLQQGKFATPTKVRIPLSHTHTHTNTKIQIEFNAGLGLAGLLKVMTSMFYEEDIFTCHVYHTVHPGRLPQSYFHTMSKFSTHSNRGLAGHQVSV